MIKLPKNVQIEEIPLEAMYRGVLCGLLTRIKVLYEAIYTRYGDDEPWNISKVGLFLIKVFNNMRSKGEVTEFSENRDSIMVPECPYPFKDIKICSAHTSMECALVHGLNPNLEYHIEHSVPAGDPFCVHVLTNDYKQKQY